MQEIEIDIVGPYSFVGDSNILSVFESPFKYSKGIYPDFLRCIGYTPKKAHQQTPTFQ